MSLNGSVESNVLRGRIADPDVIHGLSAYEIAVMHGFDGTEEEWLESLHADWDERADEAKESIDNEVDNVIVPEAKAELEEAKYTAVSNAVTSINNKKASSLNELSSATEDHIEALEDAAKVLDEKEILLWENSNLADAFSSQTIDISAKMSDDIDHLRLVFYDRVGTVVSGSVVPSIILPSIEIEKGQSGRIHFGEGSDTAKAYTRFFEVYANGNIKFEGADPKNDVCIPYKIYGVKNTAINIDYIENTANEAKSMATEAKSMATEAKFSTYREIDPSSAIKQGLYAFKAVRESDGTTYIKANILGINGSVDDSILIHTMLNGGVGRQNLEETFIYNLDAPFGLEIVTVGVSAVVTMYEPVNLDIEKFEADVEETKEAVEELKDTTIREIVPFDSNIIGKERCFPIREAGTYHIHVEWSQTDTVEDDMFNLFEVTSVSETWDNIGSLLTVMGINAKTYDAEITIPESINEYDAFGIQVDGPYIKSASITTTNSFMKLTDQRFEELKTALGSYIPTDVIDKIINGHYNDITFYVDGVAYLAGKGMTWGELIASYYNPPYNENPNVGLFYGTPNTVETLATNRTIHLNGDDFVYVYVTDTIVENGSYMSRSYV